MTTYMTLEGVTLMNEENGNQYRSTGRYIGSDAYGQYNTTYNIAQVQTM